MSDDVLAGLAAFAGVVVLMRLRRAITRRISALARMRELNRLEDERKRALPKYPPATSFFLFSQLNVLNHTRIDLPGLPHQILTWISAKHAVHHQSMRRGNYATITLAYDKLFGTLE